MPFIDRDILGRWKCRTAKLGGKGPVLVVYGQFSCRITRERGALAFQKTSGSQRTKGILTRGSPPTSSRLEYAGTGTYNDDKPLAYGADPRRDEVGLLFKVGPRRLRLEFPKPQFESDFNIIELTR